MQNRLASGQNCWLQRLRHDLDGLADRARRLDPADCDPRGVCDILDPTRP